MTGPICPSFVRDLAGSGTLTEFAATATGDVRRELRVALYEIVQPVVFVHLTRKLELTRGHRGCATSVFRLEDQCLDRFHDDMDAVLDDVFRQATMPIRNLEGWVRRRLPYATVNGYRRRRGERGALQRPRVPRWLATRLGDRARLTSLAVDLLEFVGNDVLAGPSIWPVERWAELRALTTGDYESARRELVQDIEIVLAAMRTNSTWYDAYVERPLGQKRHHMVPLPRTSDDDIPASDDDSLLIELAGLAVRSFDSRIARGENPRAVAADVLTAVFADDDLDLAEDAVARIAAVLADN